MNTEINEKTNLVTPPPFNPSLNEDTRYTESSLDASQETAESSIPVPHVAPAKKSGSGWEKVVIGGVGGIVLGTGSTAMAMGTSKSSSSRSDDDDVDERITAIADPKGGEEEIKVEVDDTNLTDSVKSNGATNFTIHTDAANSTNNLEGVPGDVNININVNQKVDAQAEINTASDKGAQTQEAPAEAPATRATVTLKSASDVALNAPSANGIENLSPQLRGLVDGDIMVAGNVNDSMSFGEAFAAARAEVGPGGVFEWHGNLYGTYTLTEWESMSAQDKMAFNDHFAWNNHHSSDALHTEVNLAEVDAEVEAIPDTDHHIEVLHTDDHVAIAQVDDNVVALIDIDQDGVYDVAISDLNHNQHLDSNEIQYIGEENITTEDIANAIDVQQSYDDVDTFDTIDMA